LILSFPRKRKSSNQTRPVQQSNTNCILDKYTGFPPARE
jgi:hypothetical protein